jgi:hypothetical protein
MLQDFIGLAGTVLAVDGVANESGCILGAGVDPVCATTSDAATATTSIAAAATVPVLTILPIAAGEIRLSMVPWP